MQTPITVDYLTLTSPKDIRYLINIPFHTTSEKDMHWQAGPALYKGTSYEYTDGNLQILHSYEQGTLIRISGSLCERMLPTIQLEYFRITRLDLCITIPVNVDVDYWYRLHRSQNVKINASLINGETLYIGSRRSQKFWRVYDKACEQNIPGPLYRIELELKGLRARLAKPHLMAGNREGIWNANRIGIISELLASLGLEEKEGITPVDMSLPRKPPAGRKFFEKVVLPFLENNPWAIDELIEKGILKDE